MNFPLTATSLFNHLARLSRLVLPALLFLLVSPTLQAQAGSSLPRVFHASEGRGATGSAVIDEPLLPTGVLRLAQEEQYLLWVELEQGRLKVLEQDGQGGLILRQSIPVSIGKLGYGKQQEGDQKTPVGVYRLTSFLKDAMLDDFYGLGAFPLNYPNVIDRQHGKTGSGIWLHGLPKDVNTRPLLDSDGCVVIDNQTLDSMHAIIKTGLTHIVLSDKTLTWVPASKGVARRAGLETAFAEWVNAWEARDNEAYLAFYAEDFSDFRRNKAQWSEYKSRVNNGKQWIEVDTSAVSFLADLHQPDLVTVRYYQNYKSSNYSWKGWKEQLWRENGEGWEIVYEGNG